MTMTNEDAILAVKKGTQWLDENHPGWERRLDLSNLEMNNCERCVIGQAVGNFWVTAGEEADRVGMDEEEWSVEHGFDVLFVGTSTTVAYRQLEAEWTRVVTERRGE